MHLVWVFFLFTGYGNGFEVGRFTEEVECNMQRRDILVDRPRYWSTSKCFQVWK